MWDWLVASGFVVLALLGLAVIWKGPQRQVARVKGLNRKERFDRENEARKTLATILGGIVLLIGGFFTWRNIKLAQESQVISQRALAVAQEGQITDRFTKAIEQLGATDASGKTKKLEVRLGGIYSLEAIANESESFHWPTMEVLCTYVRQYASRNREDSDQEDRSRHPDADIQAILTVIGRRNPTLETDRQHVTLRHTNLVGAELRGADLRDANMSRVNLSYAYLIDLCINNAMN